MLQIHFSNQLSTAIDFILNLLQSETVFDVLTTKHIEEEEISENWVKSVFDPFFLIDPVFIWIMCIVKVTIHIKKIYVRTTEAIINARYTSEFESSFGGWVEKFFLHVLSLLSKYI